MGWDLLCKFVEKKYLNGILKAPLKTFRETKVFVFDYFQLPSCQNDIQFDDTLFELAENFRLPFPQIAVQDKEGISFIMDTKKDQFGFKEKRFIVTLDCNEENKKDGMILVGTAKNIKMDRDNIEADCDFNMIDIFDKGIIVKTIKKNEISKTIPADELVNLKSLFLFRFFEVLHLIKPKNFILEETPKKVRTSTIKVPRMHERPIFTILKPNEIRKKMGLKNPLTEGSPKTPHERSGHFRTLKNERYGDRVGDRIWIKPTWVGTSEAMVGNKFYKVRLDL